ncbi:hypothetical protein [Vineibacter terrae]|uniref:hypothetical protein n=1 Tax=Vineibacter terrae TaxID=2586908 RepID=UPI002E35EE00|nr:hypothetical protein [Vineibacter terrae]HEX2887346.1 hypothetical protein [Vineibacter terrae]
MAGFDKALSIVNEFRGALNEERRSELLSLSAGDGVSIQHAPRGWGGRLARIHATGVGIRLHEGMPVRDDVVLKVYTLEEDSAADRPAILRSFEGVDVDVERLPIQVALARRRAAALPAIASHRARHRSILGGVSVAPLDVDYVGTLGCFVKSKGRGQQRIYALSNNHVLADTNKLPIGTQVCQPGPETAPTRRQTCLRG